MTNGQDIMDYEQKNHSELTERWAEKNKLKLKLKLSNDEIEELLEGCNTDFEYWQFVEDSYFGEIAYMNECIAEMSR